MSQPALQAEDISSERCCSKSVGLRHKLAEEKAALL